MYVLGLFVVFLAPFLSVQAAQVYLDTEIETRNNRDTFYVPVRIDTQGECINAVRVAVAYNPEKISVQDVVLGNSILTLWTQKPEIVRKDGLEAGRVLFEGGIPGGYCGRVAGDAGLTNTLAQLVVTGANTALEKYVSTTTQLVIEPDETFVYLHDGGGTEADITVAGVELVLQQSTTSPNNIWLTDIQSDESAPELFEITLVEGPSTGNKRHYIVFNTVDKQSGIDHYEVLETDPDNYGFLAWLPKRSYWVTAESPYVLRDQKLRSKIMVKAVDKNGNERIVTYTPPITPLEMVLSKTVLVPVGSVVIVLSLLFGLFILLKRRARAKKMLQDNEGHETDVPEHLTDTYEE
jgi:hypothetical protein